MGKHDKASTSSVPKNWPPSIRYLTRPWYSASLTQSHLTAIRTPAEVSGSLAHLPLPQLPSSSVRITPITDPSHPAHGQAGLFATRDLRPGDPIIPYLGELHAGCAADLSSDYDLWLDRAGDVAVDAARMGNEARFVNDYRGVPGAKRPNAEFREVWWTDARPGGGVGEKGMGLFVLPAPKRAVGRARTVGIAKGEEILVSYGKGFWASRREEWEGEGEGEVDEQAGAEQRQEAG